MVIPKINSAHGADTRNVINKAIEVLNVHGKTIQDLVAEGQLTPSQYAELIRVVNGMTKSGEVDITDFGEDLRKEIEGISNKIDKDGAGQVKWENVSQEVREQILGEVPPAVVGVNSVGTENIVDGSVTDEKLTPKTREAITTPITNLIDNGNFQPHDANSSVVPRWTTTYGEHTSENSVLSVVSDGSSILTRTHQFFSDLNSVKGGDSLYVRTVARVTNTSASSLTLEMAINGSVKKISGVDNPEENKWYVLEGTVNTPNEEPASIGIRINTFYESAESANGKMNQIKYTSIFNLSETFKGESLPTITEINSMLNRFPEKWFDGTENLYTLKGVITNVNKYNQKVEEQRANIDSVPYGYLYTSNGDGSANFKPAQNGTNQGSGKSATVIVAAHNSKSVDGADFICSGTKDQNVINQALHEGRGGKVIILDGDYTVSGPIVPPDKTEVEIIGDIKSADARVTHLIANADKGQPFVEVSDASIFEVGEWVACVDDNSPLQTGGTGQTRRHASCGRIVNISGNKIELNGNLIHDLSTSANASFGTMPSIILIEEKEDVYVHGTGTLDGNKVNQFDCDPVSVILQSEDTRAGCCITVYKSKNIKIDSLNTKNAILHNISSRDSFRTVIFSTKNLYAHDKNILFYRETDSRAFYNVANFAEYEDGIIAYAGNKGIVLENNICEGNNRYGISTGSSDVSCTTNNNKSKDNGRINLRYSATRSTSSGDQSVSYQSNNNYAVIIDGEDTSFFGLISSDAPNAYGAAYVYGEYIRMYSPTMQSNSTIANGLVLGASGSKSAKSVIVRDLVSKNNKTAFFAGDGIENCKVDNPYFIDNINDILDESNGGLTRI